MMVKSLSNSSSCAISLFGEELHLHSSLLFQFGEEFLLLLMLVIVSEDRVSCTRLCMQAWREFSAVRHSSSCWIQPGHALLLHCICNDYTETLPDISFCPNKDARARSVGLQLGTAHIQCSTETRQVSVVMGRTRYWLLSALIILRARKPPTRLVWFRLDTDPPDGLELPWPCPYIYLGFLHSSSRAVLVRSFSAYTPRAGFSGDLLRLHPSWY